MDAPSRFKKIQQTESLEDNAAEKVIVEGSTGILGWIYKTALSVLKASTTVSGTVKTDVNQADPVVYTKASVDTNFEIKSNKQNNLTGSDATKYPTVPAVNSGLALKANLAGPTFTGVPTVPTATAGTNTTQAASTAFVLANSFNIPHLEFNNTDKTVWNNGKGNVVSNTSFGDEALSANTTGNYNTASGYSSLSANTTGNYNTASGSISLSANTTGNYNTANGCVSLPANTTGNYNTASGYSSLFSNTTGDGNTASGYNSGYRISDGISTNAITNNSVYIGAETKALENNQINQIVIGYNAIGAGSNTATLGNTSITSTVLRGAVTATSFARTGGSANDAQMANGSVKAIGNVDNTTDLNKPVSTATQTALNGKVSGIGTTNYVPKFTASGTVGNSSIFDNGITTSIIGANSEYINADASFSIVKTTEGYGMFSGLSPSGNFWQQAGTQDGITKYNLIFNPQGGNVGINQTAPTESLDVVGNGKFSGTIKAIGLAVYADNTTATAGGLAVGTMYRTSLGIVMIVY